MAGDTLGIARKLAHDARYQDAAKLLDVYTANHPDNADALWLYGIALSNSGRNKDAIKALKQAELHLSSNHSADLFYLSYARALSYAGRYTEAEAILSRLHKGSVPYSDIAAQRAQIAYWQGRIEEAEAQVKLLARQDGTHPDLQRLENLIKAAAAPWVQATGGYRRDNQPLGVYLASIDGGNTLSSLLQPHLRIDVPTYQRDGKSNTVVAAQVGNRSQLWRKGTLLDYGIGVVRFPSSFAALTGIASIRQPFGQRVFAEFACDRSPYLATRASLDTAVMTTRAAATIGLLPWRWAAGQGAYEQLRPDDGNVITTAYAYGFGPQVDIMGTDKLFFRLGYGFTYSNALRSRFYSTETASQVAAHFEKTQFIPGFYKHYFTPRDQHAHSILAQVTVKPRPNLELGTSGGYGFYAYNLNPYLYLTQPANSDSLGFGISFARYRYTPVQATVYILWQPAPQHELKLALEHRVNPFYVANQATLSYKLLLFTTEKRKTH